MFGEDRLMSLIEKALRFSRSDQLEILVIGQDSYLTRYSENYIHQNVGERQSQVFVRAVNDKRIGISSGNQIDEDHLKTLVGTAERLSLVAERNEHFRSLPEKRPLPTCPRTFWTETSQCPPDLRAAYCERVINMAKEQRLKASGAMTTEVIEIAVANSLGVRGYTCGTRASISALVAGDDSSGFFQEKRMNVAEIDPTFVAEKAILKCQKSKRPITIEPKAYDVILEPQAVSDMIMYLSFLGFSAYSYQEGQSFMCQALGRKIAGDNVTIWDDGLDPLGFPMPFDFEGTPKEKTVFIENGIAKDLAYDSFSAGREGKRSTGHALPPGLFIGAMPMNLFVAPGENTLDEMIESTEKGLLVTRFHYVNPIHPLKTIITGMTRDGTFLIEKGKITKGVRNLRFTQSILEALNRVESIGKDRSIQGDLMSIVCPAMKIRNFAFTGVTQF